MFGVVDRLNVPEEYLKAVVEDDSSWEEYSETLDELLDDECEILTEIEKEL